MADFVTNILSKLKTRSSVTIGVSVSQSGLLEVCKYDRLSHTVSAYANRTIKYNLQNREVQDIEEFKANLLSIYQELNIPNNCSAVLSLPSVFFDITTIPLILDNFAAENVLLGEVEQSYIFKKNEPVISWTEISQNERNENRTVAYAAIQRSQMDDFVDAFNAIGTKLLAIDNSYKNLVNAISYTQIAKHEIETHAPWNIILVNNNSFIICSMTGDKLVEYYEEPLALRSIGSTEEKYSTLKESINNAITNYVANSMLLISDSDDIDASELCDSINFHGQKNYLNQNKFASGQIIDTSPNVLFSYISAITLYSLGSAVYPFLDEHKKLNLIGELKTAESQDTYDITIAGLEITKEIVQIAFIMLATVIVAIYGLLWFIIAGQGKSIESKMVDIDTKVESITQELKSLQEQDGDKKEKTFDLSTVKNSVVENNKKEIIYFNLLSFNIPRSTWLTHFYTDAKGAVAIEGKTSSTNNVYMFFKGIKASVEDSDLALTKLKYSTGFEDEIAFTRRVLYDFELSNAQYATSDKAKAAPVATSDMEDIVNQVQESVKQDKEKTKNKTSKEKTPDLPPIEDIKTSDKTTTKKSEKLTKEDTENTQKTKEEKKSSKSKSSSSSKGTKDDASLPDLPELED